jgi:hypothetical protein
MDRPYPEFLAPLENDYDGKSIIYLLEVEPSFYKFGITCDIKNRLRCHFRHLKFLSVVSIFDCLYYEVARTVETEFKRYASESKILRNKYDLTEIIQVDNISVIVEWFSDRIIKERANVESDPNYIKNAFPIRNSDKPTESPILQLLDPFKCRDCGKTFAKASDFDRHKQRKIPCLVKNLSPSQIQNPNRCLYCNKIFSTGYNLNKHQKICSVMKKQSDNSQEPNLTSLTLKKQSKALKVEQKKLELVVKQAQERLQKIKEEQDCIAVLLGNKTSELTSK